MEDLEDAREQARYKRLLESISRTSDMEQSGI